MDPASEPQDSGLEIDEAPGPRRKALLGVDIGGTKFAVGLITSRGELIDRSIAKIDRDASSGVLGDLLSSLVAEQVGFAEDRHDVELVAVGIGSAGPITPNCETVSPLNIGAWREYPLRPRIEELTGLPTFGDLDAKALALAEGWLGAAQGVSNYCAMTVSTGVGGGLVLDGRLIDGASSNAGHVGHVMVEPQGRRCRCGARGCLEAEASGSAIEAITGRPPTEPTYEIMERTGRMVGRASASMCNLFDLDLIVVGGSVAFGFAATFFNAANLELHARARSSYTRQARVVTSKLGDRGPLIGAAAVGVRGLRRRPVARVSRGDSTPPGVRRPPRTGGLG
ncbi:MAG: ROK family protein [Actinomycetota bacterium]|nr:ROK family protein [Actinomycetota bacterium]